MSKLARQLIAENKKTKNPVLDLGNCSLTSIPEEIARLTWLESLSLASFWQEWDRQGVRAFRSRNQGKSNQRLVDVGPLAALAQLRSLHLEDTQVADLTPLAGLSGLQLLGLSNTKVTTLDPLARSERLRSLDVSGTAVHDLAPLAGLKHLEELTFSGTPVASLAPLAGLDSLQALGAAYTLVTDLGPISGLAALRALDLSNTHVDDLAPLTGLTALEGLHVPRTQVTDLTPLSTLTALQQLDLAGTRVASLTPLVSLTRLQVLDLSVTRVVDLTPLASRTSLQELSLQQTQVENLDPLSGLVGLRRLNLSQIPTFDFRPLAGLAALESLNLEDTRFTNLALLTGLKALQTLDVCRTGVRDLAPLREMIARGVPVRWSTASYEGPGIYVKHCRLTSPPVEIATQGKDAILNFFRERDAGAVDHLYEAKLLILGEGRAGKTSVLRRLYRPDLPLPGESETTRGIAIHRHEFPIPNGRRFRLNVWDFGGQNIYHATHQFFLTRRSLYLLLDDTTKDHKSVSDEGFKYWLELIDLFGGHSPVVIFQNEKGGRSKAIDLAGIKGRFDNVKERYAGNLEHPTATDQLRAGIELFATQLGHIGEELPAGWIDVRANIETRAQEVPHISQQEYFEIYGRHLPFDRTKALHLSRYLHDLGVFLHFQDDALLTRTVILQNDWATLAVFRLLDDEVVKAQLGRFGLDDCERLWRDSAYADMHLELLALMQRFELCYAVADSRPPGWLVPQLLPPGKPVALAAGAPSKDRDLVLRYHYDFMPKGLISRLTVRLHRFVRDPEMAWVSGVLFARQDTSVQAEILPQGQDIELRARGPERTALLSVVAADLDALNESIQGLPEKVDKLVPCICPRCRAADVPEFFSQKDLRRRKDHRHPTVECRISYENVSVLELLEGVRIDAPPAWAAESEPSTLPPTIRIFLASSAELADDRDAFDLYFRQLNDQLRHRGIYVKIVRWENFLDAMSGTRLQDEYNKAIRDCDVFVSLFFTKTGKFTEEEFDAAHRQFKETGRPRIYTFFKNADVKTGSVREEDLTSLWAFKKRLHALGHFHTSYDNEEHLKRQFRDQLEKLLAGQ